ncbi:MAG: hypothetical protein H6711_32100 [Myxococcales bacterium]|nr:hypothetical protein [Myxococcales bacterium]
MFGPRTLLVTSLGLLPVAACFTGEAALGLPCDDALACGEGQECIQGLCSLPGIPACGNNLVNPGEECDDGDANGDDAACTASCKVAVCGDGLVGPGEACDEGSNNGVGSCTLACTVSSCGDGMVVPGEECDPGAADPGTCTPSCTSNVCGDSFVGVGEACDSEDRDACTVTCKAIFFRDRVEGGINGWTHEVVTPPPNNDCKIFCFKDLWARTTNIPSVESHGDAELFTWYSGNLSSVRGPGSTRLISPEIDLTDAAAPIILNFDHYFAFKTAMMMPNYFADGAIVEVSRDGGDFEQLQLSGYTGTIVDAGGCQNGIPKTKNPLLGYDAFVGRSQSWIPETGLLDAYAGSKIRLGFQIASDCASLVEPWTDGTVEWYLDNIFVFGDVTGEL